MQSLERNIHPVVIIYAFNKAMKEVLAVVGCISISIGMSNATKMLALIKMSIGTKIIIRWSKLICGLTIAQSDTGLTKVDIKRYARVGKVPGGEIEESRILNSIMLNKDITHWKRRIESESLDEWPTPWVSRPVRVTLSQPTST